MFYLCWELSEEHSCPIFYDLIKNLFIFHHSGIFKSTLHGNLYARRMQSCWNCWITHYLYDLISLKMTFVCLFYYYVFPFLCSCLCFIVLIIRNSNNTQKSTGRCHWFFITAHDISCIQARGNNRTVNTIKMHSVQDTK